MYSNDEKQIRAGLVNFIGSLLKASKETSNSSYRAQQQNVASILTEETIKLSQDNDGLIDLYIVKPLIRGVSFVYGQRIKELKKLPQEAQVKEKIEFYESLIKALNDSISMV